MRGKPVSHGLWAWGAWSAALLLSSCGYDYNSKVNELRNGSNKAASEFADQNWFVPKSASAAANQFPAFSVNFKRAAQPTVDSGLMADLELESGALSLAVGDQLWLGAKIRGSLSEECGEEGSALEWQEITSVSSLLDHYQNFSTTSTALIAQQTLNAGVEYVLCLKLVRQVGEEAIVLAQIPNVAPFVVDTRTPVASSVASSGHEPARPIGLDKRLPSYGMKAGCSFGGGNPQPGDYAYATLLNFKVSEELDLIGYTADPMTGVVELMLLLSPINFPELASGVGLLKVHCVSRAGKMAEATLANGVDYTPPVAKGTSPNQTLTTAAGATVTITADTDPIAVPASVTLTPASLSLATASLTSQVSAVDVFKAAGSSGGSGKILNLVSGDGAVGLAPANFNISASTCNVVGSGATARHRCSWVVSLAPRGSQTPGTYVFSARIQDAAGNQVLQSAIVTVSGMVAAVE